MNFDYYAVPAGWGYYFYTFHFFALAVLAEYLLLRSARLSDYKKQNQLKYVITGTTLGYITGGVSFLPVFGILVEPTLTHFLWIYLAIITYAIVKHELLDINVVIKKSAVYSATLLVISTLYTAIIYVFISTSENFINSSSLLATILTILAISVTFAPLHGFLNNRISYLFFHSSPALLAEKNTQMMQELQKQDQMKAVATLAAGMAHEIKNPLTALKTFTEYLPEKSGDPEFLNKFQRIVKTEVTKIDDIVKQLLEFSKPSTPQLQSMDIAEPINETLEFLSNSLLKHSIRLEKDLGHGGSKIMGDKKQLKQVLLNILLNSIDAMSSGGTLTIKTYNESNKLILSVSDTGTGISKEDLPHLFDPFFSKKPDGTGLGLSIAKGIIEEHRGKIRVSSIVNSGTEFALEFSYA